MGTIYPQVRNYLGRYPDDESVVKPFLSGFSARSAFRKENRQKNELSAFHLEPDPDFAELLGFERGLLLALDREKQFDTRVITLLDKILEEERAIIDPMASVLVTNDESGPTKISEFLSREPEHGTIVALSRPDVNAISRSDDLRRLFTESLFKRDLFALESPLTKESLFFGRDGIINVLSDRFKAGQNSGLFGLRRMGKTSVLYAVERRVRQSQLGAVVYIDLSTPAYWKARWWNVLQQLVMDCAESLGLTDGEGEDVRALRREYAEETAARDFRHDIQRLLRRAPRRRILVELDEIEHCTFGISPADHWATDFLPFWQTMRSVHQVLHGQFCYILAGVNPRVTEMDRVGKFDNPLFSTVEAYYLRPFENEVLRRMVRHIAKYMGLEVEDEVYELLRQEYGGHPYLTRQACSHLAKHVPERPGRITRSLLVQDKDHIALTLDKNIRQILNVLAIWYPNEYQMICDLARGEKESFIEFANLDAEFTQHMEGYGIVESPRADPKMIIGIAKSHLSKIVAPARRMDTAEDSEDDVLAEISRRRNAIEKELRALLRDGLRFKHGGRAAARVLRCVPEQRRDILSEFSYEEMWEEMFFDELRLVLAKEWDAFQVRLAVEKEKALTWMDQMNRSRADAHARSLGQDDLAFLRIAFTRFEEILGIQGA